MAEAHSPVVAVVEEEWSLVACVADVVALEALLMALFTATTLLSSTVEGWEGKEVGRGEQECPLERIEDMGYSKPIDL